jgi:hypothetical protein
MNYFFQGLKELLRYLLRYMIYDTKYLVQISKKFKIVCYQNPVLGRAPMVISYSWPQIHGNKHKTFKVRASRDIHNLKV